jgi:class 3 adenylate cyclase
MERSAARSHVTVSFADLEAVTRTAVLRLDAPDDEAARAAYVRSVMQAAFDLSSSLRSYARCGLVNGQGSHGASDLPHETAVMFGALEAFAALVRRSASDALGAREPAAAVAARGWRRAG